MPPGWKSAFKAGCGPSSIRESFKIGRPAAFCRPGCKIRSFNDQNLAENLPGNPISGLEPLLPKLQNCTDPADLKGSRKPCRIRLEILTFDPKCCLKRSKTKPKYPARYSQTGTRRHRKVLGQFRVCFDDDPNFLNCEISQPSKRSSGSFLRDLGAPKNEAGVLPDSGLCPGFLPDSGP